MVARIIELCARNRMMVLVAAVVAAAAAALSIQRVKLDAVPDLTDPQVIVQAEWMGRSPTLVEDQVTYPLVSSLLAAPRVADVRGYSMFGMSFVYVLFEEGTDMYWARTRVLEHLGTLRQKLPEGVTPVLGPDATGIGWTFQYTLVDRSGEHRIDELRALQDSTLRYALGSVDGVAEVASIGGYEKQYQVTVDPNQLRAYGVTLPEVVEAIRESNDEVGGRVVEMTGREYYVRGRGTVDDLAAIEQVVVRTSGAAGVPVRVGDVGKVRFGPQIRRGLLDWNGEGEAVGGIVVMRHGENALQVIDRVKAKLADLAPAMPEGVAVEIAYDRSDVIHRAIATLRKALVEEVLVVGGIIVLFLLHLRSALLPILSLPMAIALAFIPMVVFDVPATIMSLGGIAIAIGATVDAELVMIEASHKKLELAPPGADRHALLAEAAREVTPALFFSLLVIAVAFLPVFTLTGQAGRLFRPLALTKTFVMVAAALLSITAAPALRDVLIRGRIRPEREHLLSRLIIRVYRPFVYVALRRPRSTVAIGVLAILSAVPLARDLGHEFMPPLNEGDVLYMPTTMPNISIEEAKRAVRHQDRILRSFPEVASVFGKVGRAETATDPAPLTMIETTVRLKPVEQWRTVPRERWYSRWAPAATRPVLRLLWPDERRISWDELTTAMNDAMQLPGWTNAFTMPIRARVDMLTTGVKTPVGVKVMGARLADVEQAGVALERIVAAVPGTRSAFYERNSGGLYLDIVPDRAAIARYGLRVGDVNRTIEAAIGGAPITTTVEGRSRFTVNVRYPQDLRGDVEKLRRVLVPLGRAGTGGGGGMGQRSDASPSATPRILLANMGGGAASSAASTGPRPAASGATATDAVAPWVSTFTDGSAGASEWARSGAAFVPLGQLADIRIVSGPPMLRDEDGLLTGYVYVDVDQQQRDIGGYVDDAKGRVAAAIAGGTLKLPSGTFLKWTGQYELLEQMNERMKIVLPLTLLLIVGLLFAYFRNLTEVLIVLLSVPFALVGSVWLMWLLDYRFSTAAWVGVIALVGLAAQTGIVMIVYIDQAYERRKRAGKIRDLSDIIWAHMEGTVMRVRPKLMTVATMLLGLVPLLWASGTGADVMKRIAAPMVGGLITSAFLTLEIIPVVYTAWRQEQLIWEALSRDDPRRLRTLQVLAGVHKLAWLAMAIAAVVPVYVAVPAVARHGVLAASALVALATAAAYLVERRPAAQGVRGAA